jgi:hypothetical protein
LGGEEGGAHGVERVGDVLGSVLQVWGRELGSDKWNLVVSRLQDGGGIVNLDAYLSVPLPKRTSAASIACFYLC